MAYLHIRVGDPELDALDVFDHVIDGVGATATDAKDLCETRPRSKLC